MVSAAFVIALSQPPEPAAEASRRHFGYVHASPGLGGFGIAADATFPTWAAGANLSWHFRSRGMFTGELGVFRRASSRPALKSCCCDTSCSAAKRASTSAAKPSSNSASAF